MISDAMGRGILRESGSHETSIQVLAPDVAARIAAGEVVERAANAAKELIENSLDAGATVVHVEVREGGQRLLRVTDNGAGIHSAEASIALERHATSKLQRSEQLEEIETFGFRGEALYSIAAVSHLTLQSRTRDEDAGTLLEVEGGALRSASRLGAPAGTTVTVQNLFFNTPARLKFLRSAIAEAGQIAAVVQRYALAFPDVRFTYVNDGRTTLQTSGSGELFDVLVQLHGLETARQMVVFDSQETGVVTTPEADVDADIDFGEPGASVRQYVGAPVDDDSPIAGTSSDPATDALTHRRTESPLRVYGYTSLPTLTRGNRSAIQLFVNRRAIDDRTLTHAVVQAYHTLLPVGRFPVAVVFIETDPSLVDVNVHPQKLQVRFAQERRVFNEVQKAVRYAVIARNSLPGMLHAGVELPGTPPPSAPLWESSGWSARREAILGAGSAPLFGESVRQYVGAPGEIASPATDAPATDAPATETPATETPTHQDTETLPPLRVVGQVGATYIVAEGPAGMFLIDQHAAHERILYEEYMRERNLLGAEEPPRQQLLQPLALHAGSAVAGEVAVHLRELQRVGYEIDAFGGDSWIVRAVPALLAGEDPLGSLLDIVSSLAAGRNLVREGYEAELVKTICKRAAIKGGQLLSLIEMQELLRQLEECRSPRTCPHGRPTMIQISAGDLQKAFGRI